MANRTKLPELPFRELSRLQGRIDRMLGDFFSEPFAALATGEEGESFVPACDIEETDQQYLLSFDLPGVQKSDVKIELKNNQLVVSGERKYERKLQEKGRASRERYYGTFLRSFALPSDVKAEQVEAHYENGVLQIAIPKSQPSGGKQIEIKEGKLLESSKKAA